MTVSGFDLPETYHPINTTLLIATVWTINHIYAEYSNELSFSLWSRTADEERYQTLLLSDILTSIRDTKFTYVIQNKENIECRNILQEGITKCLQHKDVILMVDSFETFMQFKKELVNDNENYLIRGFYTIIYTGNKQHYIDVISRIFHEVFYVFMMNVNVYVEVLDETLVYSYFPFTPFHCHRTSAVLVNRFTTRDGFVFPNYNFFPQKTENFFGCPLAVATWKGPPFIFFKQRPYGEIKVYGIEGELINMLATKMNFKINLIEANKRGRVFPNLTAVEGAVKLVIDGLANITINSFVYSDFALKAMLASYTYTSYAIVVAVPQGHPLSSLQRLTKPFKYIIWSCLSSSVLAGIVIIFVIQFLRKKSVREFVFGPLNATPFTNLLNVFLGGPVTVTPRRNFARYILLVWLVYTMVLRNAYSGELYIMLQDSTSFTSIETIEEMAEQNFTFWCADNTVEVVKKSTHAYHARVIRGQPFQYLAQLHDSNSKIGVVVLNPFLRIYNHIMHGRAPIQTLPTKLVSAPLTMYFRRHSYLVETVNKYLVAFVAAGLLEAWDRFYLPRYKQEDTNREPAVLTVQLLMGLFSAYLIFLGISFLVFLLEMWSKRSPICRSIVNFFNC